MSVNSQGVKNDTGKLRYSLLPTSSVEEVVKVLMNGAVKYGDRNWEQGINYSRVYDATQRHLNSWWAGEDNDVEDNLSHLAHAACNILFLLHYSRSFYYNKFDDRPPFEIPIMPILP